MLSCGTRLLKASRQQETSSQVMEIAGQQSRLQRGFAGARWLILFQKAKATLQANIKPTGSKYRWQIVKTSVFE